MTDSGVPVSRWRSGCDVLLALCGLALACSVHGAIPGWMLPVQLQMLWSGGFAESLANQGWLALYAHDFGLPAPAPISFGLSAVLPMAALIRWGMPLQDAYSLTVMLWLAIAFVGAAALAARLGVQSSLSWLLATCWLTLPVVWGHAGYSMLALGIALLPAYLLMVPALLQSPRQGRKPWLAHAVLAVLVAGVSVFMDGYTFVMYGVGSVLLIAVGAFGDSGRARAGVWVALATQLVAFAVAYLAYRRYVGAMPLEAPSMDMFRAFALDLHHVAVPTRGVHPLFDFFGWSVDRSLLDQYGDRSVWTTTFALPLLAVAVFAWIDRNTRTTRLWFGISAVVLVSMYFALGPSLKVFSAQSFTPSQIGTGLMPASAGLVETGNEWISRHVPGFSSMRASYRWTALGLCGLWMLVAVWAGRRWRGRQAVPMAVVATVIALQLPDLAGQWQEKRQLRDMFLSLDREIGRDMATLPLQDKRVVFLPTGNDFLVNHIAARYRLSAYNIGGDKNVELARSHWPSTIQRARARAGSTLATEIRTILLKGDADAVVLPLVGLLEGASTWPCEALSPLSQTGSWSRRGTPLEEQRLGVTVPVDARLGEHPVYLRRAAAAPGAAAVTVSLHAAPAGTVLQQRTPDGVWAVAGDVRPTSAPEVRLLLPTPPSCRTPTCAQDLTLGWKGAPDFAVSDLEFTNVGPECPGPVRDAMRTVLQELRSDALFDVQEGGFFSVIRPGAQWLAADVPTRNAMLADFLAFPLSTSSQEVRLAAVLGSGWHEPEATHVWSGSQATLSIPVPARCREVACDIRLEFFAVGASPSRPVSVTATHARHRDAVTWSLPTDARFVGRLPLVSDGGLDNVRLDVPQALSPRQQGTSQDSRVLGIALSRIDVQPASAP